MCFVFLFYFVQSICKRESALYYAIFIWWNFQCSICIWIESHRNRLFHATFVWQENNKTWAKKKQKKKHKKKKERKISTQQSKSFADFDKYHIFAMWLRPFFCTLIPQAVIFYCFPNIFVLLCESNEWTHLSHICNSSALRFFFLGDQVVRFILFVCMYVFFYICYICPIPLNSEAWLRNIQTNKAMSNTEKYNKNKIYLNAKANAPLYTYIYLFILQTHPWVQRAALRRRQRDSTDAISFVHRHIYTPWLNAKRKSTSCRIWKSNEINMRQS